MINLREKKVRTIITKSKLPGADYTINPYTGCLHNCVYCYARFMKKFTNHLECWGSFVDVKINAPDLIPQNTAKYQGKVIFLSSVTDAYQPLERKYGLTRRILQKLIPLQPNLCLQTKSDLVLRDIDLLKQFKNCEVGLTITTVDDTLRKEIEPLASPVSNRIMALEKLQKAGIATYVFIGPILPFLTNWRKIVLKTKCFAKYFMFENLNIHGTIWLSVKNWLKIKHPQLLKSYEQIYFTPNDYWQKEARAIKNFCQPLVDCRIYFHH